MIWTEEELERFDREGFLIVRELLSRTEVDLLSRIAREERELAAKVAVRGDGEGGEIRLVVENELTEDVYSAIVRSGRIVGRMEELLCDEVYHYHHKLILKDAHTGGAWAWHQDYGYWYNNGCLAPDLASCLIAIDPATKENGCLQVVPESHHLGRIDHMKVGDQTGADPERVAAVVARSPIVYCEMSPGDAIFFHSNLLHRSDQNHSPNPRWAFICCYNARRNDPYKESRHPRYSPLEILDDSAILETGNRQLESILASRDA